MKERIGDALGTVHDNYVGSMRRTNPDLYSATDATHALSRIQDKKYLLGSGDVGAFLNRDRAKIWSLPPEVLEKIKDIIKNAGHVHLLPFIMGTYNMGSQTMRMNDICTTDPLTLGLLATGGLEGFGTPILRGIYFLGRPNWWRHESIHARHHHQMAYFLDAGDTKKASWNSWRDKTRMEEAAVTVHEAGIEELLTRFQSLKESRGKREATMASLALLLYLEYAPFTGLRNLMIDTKEKTLDLLKDERVRIPAKIASTLGVIAIPFWLDGQIAWMDKASQLVSSLTPFSENQVHGLISRGVAYIDVATVSAMFSTKEKGAFEKKEKDGQRLPTTEYKFPYAYNPLTSLGRSLDFLLYLQAVWGQIPNYRLLEKRRDLDKLKREIDDRASKLGQGSYKFTMQVVESALRSIELSGRSAYPQDVYVKGLFTPAMYIELRDKYPTPSAKVTAKEETKTEEKTTQ